MLKEALEYIVSLKTPRTYEVQNMTFASEDLVLLDKRPNRPGCIKLHSLDALISILKIEHQRDEIQKPIFVHVISPTQVQAFTSYRADDLQRDQLYTVEAVLPQRKEGWMNFDQMMISLRSQYIPTEDMKYIVELLSKVSDENSVQSNDNGLTQQVTVKSGISMAQKAMVRPRVSLTPFRTFVEVEQPTSEFLLRLRSAQEGRDSEAAVALFEADGGAWQLEAKRNVAEYLRTGLQELTSDNRVVVME